MAGEELADRHRPFPFRLNFIDRQHAGAGRDDQTVAACLHNRAGTIAAAARDRCRSSQDDAAPLQEAERERPWMPW